jgi:hypothetical protein
VCLTDTNDCVIDEADDDDDDNSVGADEGGGAAKVMRKVSDKGPDATATAIHLIVTAMKKVAIVISLSLFFSE